MCVKLQKCLEFHKAMFSSIEKECIGTTEYFRRPEEDVEGHACVLLSFRFPSRFSVFIAPHSSYADTDQSVQLEISCRSPNDRLWRRFKRDALLKEGALPLLPDLLRRKSFWPPTKKRNSLRYTWHFLR